MRASLHLVVLGGVCVLHVLASTATGYERNTSRSLFKQCPQASSSAIAQWFTNDLVDSNTAYDILLLSALQLQPDLNRVDEYRSLYNKFAQRTNCASSDSHEEIKALASECLCSSIRNSIVTAVKMVYRCDVAAAPHGELPAVYLALGRRINVFKRQAVQLHGVHPSVLKWYDTYFDKCYIEFFQRISESMQLSGKTATTHTFNPTASSERPSEPRSEKPTTAPAEPQTTTSFPWFFLLPLVVTAGVCVHYFFEHQHWRQRVRQRLRPPTPLLVGAAAAVDEILASTDGVAQPD